MKADRSVRHVIQNDMAGHISITVLDDTHLEIICNLIHRFIISRENDGIITMIENLYTNRRLEC